MVCGGELWAWVSWTCPLRRQEEVWGKELGGEISTPLLPIDVSFHIGLSFRVKSPSQSPRGLELRLSSCFYHSLCCTC